MIELQNLQGEEVSQNLNWVVEVRQTVNDGDGGLLIQLLQSGLAVHTSQDNIAESWENPKMYV